MYKPFPYELSFLGGFKEDFFSLVFLQYQCVTLLLFRAVYAQMQYNIYKNIIYLCIYICKFGIKTIIRNSGNT